MHMRGARSSAAGKRFASRLTKRRACARKQTANRDTRVNVQVMPNQFVAMRVTASERVV